MVTLTKAITVLDPTGAVTPREVLLAQRPRTLEGKAVGLLANGKRNADELLEMVSELLQERYRFREVIARNKGNAGRPAPKELLDELAQKCDVVITATGD